MKRGLLLTGRARRVVKRGLLLTGRARRSLSGILCALGAELTHHLGYGRGEIKPDELANHRNGTSGKTVLTHDGLLAIEVPRDRAGSFEPQLIGKHERRFTGLDDKILALYARGLANWKERKALAAALRPIYTAPSADAALDALTTFEASSWGTRFPTIGKMWRACGPP